MAPSGQLLGALTISNSVSPQVAGVTELTQIAVARMERSLIREIKSPFVMHLHPHIDGLGSSTEGLIALGADGEVIGLNSAAVRMLGRRAAELTGQTLESVFDRNPLQFLSATSNSATVLRVRNGLGVSALLTRNSSPTISTEIRIKPSQVRNNARTDLRLIEPLSKRELQVLNHLKLGLTNHELARCLFISEDSIKYHLKNIFQKLRSKSRLETVKIARDLGLIPEDLPMPSKTSKTSETL
jgi:DNA-binding CsgD family transcriptional regulator